VHAWRWRDATPTGEQLDIVCDVTGAKAEDWKTKVATKKKRAA
jgi:hypothetical protein